MLSSFVFNIVVKSFVESPFPVSLSTLLLNEVETLELKVEIALSTAPDVTRFALSFVTAVSLFTVKIEISFSTVG